MTPECRQAATGPLLTVEVHSGQVTMMVYNCPSEVRSADNGRRYLAPRYAIASADQPPLPRLYSATGMALRRRYK